MRTWCNKIPVSTGVSVCLCVCVQLWLRVSRSLAERCYCCCCGFGCQLGRFGSVERVRALRSKGSFSIFHKQQFCQPSTYLLKIHAVCCLLCCCYGCSLDCLALRSIYFHAKCMQNTYAYVARTPFRYVSNATVNCSAWLLYCHCIVFATHIESRHNRSNAAVVCVYSGWQNNG